MKKITLNKFITEMEKAEVNKIVKIPGEIEFGYLNTARWTHMLKTKMELFNTTCIATSLVGTDKVSGNFGFKTQLGMSEIFAVELPDGRKYFADVIDSYTGGKTKMPKLPNGWKVLETEAKAWEEKYRNLLRQKYDNAKVNDALVKKIYNHFRAELDDGKYFYVTKNISNFVDFAILTKDAYGKIKCDFTLDDNTLRLPSYEYYFGNTYDIGPRCHMNEIIMRGLTPEDVLDKVMTTKRETDIRYDLLQHTLAGERQNLDKLFKINNSKKLYTTYEIMIEVKSALTAISRLFGEILNTKNGKILMDFIDAKKHYWKNISPLCDYFITLYKCRKEEYTADTIHGIIIERALKDCHGNDDYVPISKIAIREVSSSRDKECLVYKMPKPKKK